MNFEPQLYKCDTCGQIVAVVQKGDGTLVCCGKPMTQLEPNTQDAAQEKHVPVVEREGNKVTVKVGSVLHPMTEQHSIQWVYLLTDKAGYRRRFTSDDTPEAVFENVEGQPIAVYEYCNLHGLWKKDL